MKKESKSLRKIIDAAKKEFSKNGFNKTTVQMIMQRAKLGKGTFYLYFKTKEDVVTFMMDEMFEMAYGTLVESLNTIKRKEKDFDFEKLFKGVTSQILKGYHKDKDVLLTVVYSNYEVSPRVNKAKEKHLNKIQGKIKEILQIGIDHGYIRKVDINIVSILLLLLFQHFSIEILFKHGINKLQYYVDQNPDFVFKGLLV